MGFRTIRVCTGRGAFPIRLENCQTVIGTITCSGFNHEQDHSIIIDVCRKLKRENVL